MAQAKRPLISPDAYSGDTSWTDWVDHFEATALVNGWDNAAKLVWLPVRLTGKAQVAWKRFPVYFRLIDLLLPLNGSAKVLSDSRVGIFQTPFQILCILVDWLRFSWSRAIDDVQWELRWSLLYTYNVYACLYYIYYM